MELPCSHVRVRLGMARLGSVLCGPGSRSVLLKATENHASRAASQGRFSGETARGVPQPGSGTGALREAVRPTWEEWVGGADTLQAAVEGGETCGQSCPLWGMPRPLCPIQ